MNRIVLNIFANALIVVLITACSGGGRISAISLDEFKRRFNEIYNDGFLGNDAPRASYAASNKSLEEFKRRYNEVYNDGFLGNDAPRAIYAASNKNLEELKRRMAEASANASFSSEIDAIYAAN